MQGLVARGRCGWSACPHPEASPFSSSRDPTVPPSSALQSPPGALLLPSAGPTGLPFAGTSLHLPMQSSHQSPGKPPGVPEAGPSLVPSDLWDPCVCPALSCPSEHPPAHSDPFRGCLLDCCLTPPPAWGPESRDVCPPSDAGIAPAPGLEPAIYRCSINTHGVGRRRGGPGWG